MNEKDIRHIIKSKNLFKNNNSWIIQCAIKDAQTLFKKHKDKKIIFGGKYNLSRYLKGLITKDEYKLNKLRPLNIQGEIQYYGNRLFKFDLHNNLIIFRPKCKTKINIELPNLRKNFYKELNEVQEYADNKKLSITVSLNKEFIYLTYDETVIPKENKFKDLKNNRVLGIDLNPNYIGLSVIEFDKQDKFKVLFKEVADLSKLNTLLNVSSNHKKQIKQNNKRDFELIESCHYISKLVDKYKCSKISIEDLNIISSNKNKGKSFNRLCNNVWCRNLISNKLKMLSFKYGFEIVEVNPAYSSQIGNILYGDKNTPDMIASSIEIARRGYKKFEKGWFYPEFNTSCLNEQWKQTLNNIKGWKETFNLIKNSKLKYRVLLDISNAYEVLRLKSFKTKIVLYSF